jgi:hypothetical protein
MFQLGRPELILLLILEAALLVKDPRQRKVMLMVLLASVIITAVLPASFVVVMAASLATIAVLGVTDLRRDWGTRPIAQAGQDIFWPVPYRFPFSGSPLPRTSHWKRTKFSLVLCLLANTSYKGNQGAVMPTNGEINKRFGVYRSFCCGAEIVIIEAATFPDCPNHPKLTTKWIGLADEHIPHVSELPTTKKKRRDDSAA